MVGQVIRRLVASFLRAALLRPRMVFGVGFVLALMVVGVALAMPPSSTSQGSPNAAPRGGLPSNSGTVRVGAQAPVPAVQSYIDGMTSFDAKRMWDALSDDAVRQMQASGISVEQLQANLNEAKQRGATYDAVAFVGDYQLQDGGRYLFYVISRRGFNMNAPDRVEQVWFVFTVDTSGKIAKID